jgi:hypothetical protein
MDMLRKGAKLEMVGKIPGKSIGITADIYHHSRTGETNKDTSGSHR